MYYYYDVSAGLLLEKSEDKITKMEFANHVSIPPRVNVFRVVCPVTSDGMFICFDAKARNRRVSNTVEARLSIRASHLIYCQRALHVRISLVNKQLQQQQHERPRLNYNKNNTNKCKLLTGWPRERP
jgi:hypothetical protein